MSTVAKGERITGIINSARETYGNAAGHFAKASFKGILAGLVGYSEYSRVTGINDALSQITEFRAQIFLFDKDITFFVVMAIGMAFAYSGAKSIGRSYHDFSLARELRNEARILRAPKI